MITIPLFGLIYLIAIVPFLFQYKGLYGAKGILPFKTALFIAPTLFKKFNSDRSILTVLWIGVILAFALLMGIWPPVMLIGLYIIYLSIVNAGQIFLGYGWETFLLEITVNLILISLGPSPLALISANFLLFRFHVMAGVVKFQSGDPNWKNMTGIAYHYETQPLPNTQAYFFHKLPLIIQKFSAVNMFVIEILVPFLIWGTHEMRLIAFVLFTALQFSIWFTGNFSYLNYLTVAISTILLYPLWPLPPFKWIDLIAAPLLLLQILRFYHQLNPHVTLEFWLNKFNYYHIVNRYGIFAVMTTIRYEIVLEGSDDGIHWDEYEFKYKPGKVNYRPRRISPYQPRLDWQMWFLPFTNWNRAGWFSHYLVALLKGHKDVWNLMKNPPSKPPKMIRALIYHYQFTSWKEKCRTGHWWTRALKGVYCPALSLPSDKAEE